MKVKAYPELSFDHLVCTGKERWRDRQTKALGCSEIDRKLEFDRHLDREITGRNALQDLIYERGRPPEEVANMGTSVEMLEDFYGKKRVRDPKMATELTKGW